MALVVKDPPTNAGDVRDMGLIPESGSSPGERNGNPLQDSCPAIYSPRGHTESDTTDVT